MSFERDAVLVIYDRLIAEFPDLQRKGKANAYTAINGNMFSFVGPDGEMCLRLSKDDIAAFGADHDNSPVIRYNSVMNGYVAIGADLLRDDKELADWFARSADFARTLKPKATRKKS